MKTLKKYLAIILLVNLFNLNICPAQNSNISFQLFYDHLSPYGSWITYPDYGYVWIPTAGPEFFPYSSQGYWTYTEFGWTWMSEYAWGWAPFHYGRWIFDSYYGWLWVPGEEWGPAWVVWRRSPGYYGWAPIAPGISINYIIAGSYQPAHDHWVFVDEHYIGRPDINQYYGPRKNNTQLINNSTAISNTRADKNRNTTYISGPAKNEVQKIRGAEIQEIPVKESTKPEQIMNNDQLSIFRQPITKNTEAKPERVIDKKDIKPLSDRKEPGTDSKPIQKEREIEPLKKNQPQPVVPDNTRTKKVQPKIVPKDNEVKEEAPQKSRQKENLEVNPVEPKEPFIPTQKDETPVRDIPAKPIEKREPFNVPHKPETRQKEIPPPVEKREPVLSPQKEEAPKKITPNQSKTISPAPIPAPRQAPKSEPKAPRVSQGETE